MLQQNVITKIQYLGKHNSLKIFGNIDRMITGLSFTFKFFFISFLCKALAPANFDQNGNKEDLNILLVFSYKKSANVSTLSLITLIGISETW